MAIYENPAELLSKLIQFDTTNPPGHERACIEYIDGLLRDAGIQTVMVGKHPDRPNLIARIKGRGEAAPLLMYGHVDVVPAGGQAWEVPPFEGRIQEGEVWGRGALDMKSGDVMFLCAMLRAQAEKLDLPGDLILMMLSDEEQGGTYGARYIVEEQAAHLEGVKYALGEFGGFSSYSAGHRFYRIQTAERRVCTVELTVRGPGGHGSLRHTGTAMAKLGRVLTTLDHNRLPVHVLPLVDQMLKITASKLDGDQRDQLLALTDPTRTDAVLDAAGLALRGWESLLHNSVNATIVRGGTATNVIPSEIVLTLDGRVLPAITTETFLAEIQALVGDDVELRAVVDEPVQTFEPDLTHFDLLGSILTDMDPTGTPMPHLTSGATDGRHLARLGIQTYGFIPMKLPADFEFASLIHSANERIPVEGLEFGVEAVYRAVKAIQYSGN